MSTNSTGPWWVKCLSCDTYCFPDTLKLNEFMSLQGWFRQLFKWMIRSSQGKLAKQFPNNQGLFYHIELSCIASFLGDTEMVFKSDLHKYYIIFLETLNLMKIMTLMSSKSNNLSIISYS